MSPSNVSGKNSAHRGSLTNCLTLLRLFVLPDGVPETGTVLFIISRQNRESHIIMEKTGPFLSLRAVQSHLPV